MDTQKKEGSRAGSRAASQPSSRTGSRVASPARGATAAETQPLTTMDGQLVCLPKELLDNLPPGYEVRGNQLVKIPEKGGKKRSTDEPTSSKKSKSNAESQSTSSNASPETDSQPTTTNVNNYIYQMPGSQLGHKSLNYLSTAPAKFEDTDSYPWEEFELNVATAVAGANEEQAKSTLISLLGDVPRAWYIGKQGMFREMDFRQMLDAFRDYFSQLTDKKKELPPHIFPLPGESAKHFSSRITREHRHLQPREPILLAGESPEEFARNRAAYLEAMKIWEKPMIQNVKLVYGGRYVERLDNKKHTGDDLDRIVKTLTKWEVTRLNAVKTTMLIAQQAGKAIEAEYAATYMAMKQQDEMAAMSPEAIANCEENPEPYLTLAAQLMQTMPQTSTAKEAEERRKKSVQFQIEKEKKEKELMDKLERSQALLTDAAEVLQQQKTHGDELVKRVEKMMTVDTKPTAKAGTKMDPTTADCEAEIIRKAPCIHCARSNHPSEKCFSLPENKPQRTPRGRGRSNPGYQQGGFGNNPQYYANPQQFAGQMAGQGMPQGQNVQAQYPQHNNPPPFPGQQQSRFYAPHHQQQQMRTANNNYAQQPEGNFPVDPNYSQQRNFPRDNNQQQRYNNNSQRRGGNNYQQSQPQQAGRGAEKEPHVQRYEEMMKNVAETQRQTNQLMQQSIQQQSRMLEQQQKEGKETREALETTTTMMTQFLTKN